MKFDITKRLREPPFGTETSERLLMTQAADEIDRLTRERDAALKEVAGLRDYIVECDEAALDEARERLEKVDRIRALGWVVAVHNDYRLNGEAHTFWLFTRDGRAVKGEGRTDDEALTAVLAEIAALSTQESSAALAGDGKESGR